MQRILVIEDDVTTRRALKILLEMQKYCVLEAVDGVDGLNMFDDTCSLIIVDIMMPRMSGIEVCKKIREISNVPILFLTARSTAAVISSPAFRVPLFTVTLCTNIPFVF